MEILLFKYPHCPYCAQAEEIIAELYKEHPEYSKIKIKRVDEVANEELSSQYDYNYTPCFFNGKKKIYEADASYSRLQVKGLLKEMFDSLL
jgi:glutaredoxin